MTIDIDYPKAGLLRPISDGERAAYDRDGAAIVKHKSPRTGCALIERENVTHEAS